MRPPATPRAYSRVIKQPMVPTERSLCRDKAQNRRGGPRWLIRFVAYLLAILGATGFHAESHASPAASPLNEEILRAQLFLDASAWKPGAIDGRWGEFMRKALTRYDQAQKKTGQKYGEKAPARFDLPVEEAKPLLISYTLSPNDQKFIGKVPASHAEQAKTDSLPYENFLELLGEKFHARRDFLRQINPGVDWGQLKPGDQVQVPNVATPFDVQEAIDLKTQTEQAEKANALKTEDKKPESERFSIFVDVKEKILELKQGGKLVGSYPITPGSKSLPAPIGEWVCQGFLLDADLPLG